MRPHHLCVLAALGGALGDVRAQHLIPTPRHQQAGAGPAVACSGKVVAADPALARVAAALTDDLGARTGRGFACADEASPGAIVLALEPGLAGEAYRVVIDAGGIVVAGASPAAVAFGTATLLQLIDDAGSLPATKIEDAPGYGWRLLMLDVARRHHTLDELRQQIQLCRFYKLRQLQLHLTDDQDFMFGSTRFPKLGADNPSGKPPYSRAELQELVAYATDRGVVLIPELDVPGHSTRLRRAHPEAFATKDGRLDVSDAGTMRSLCELLDEMCEVFPGSPVHVGCDESGVGTSALSAFITTLHEHLTQRGRQTIVWEGFGSGGKVPPDVLVMIWANAYQPAAEQLAHHRCLNGTWDPCYVVEHYPLDNLTYTPPARVLGWQPELFRDFQRGGGEAPVADLSNVAGGFLCWWEGHGRNALPLLRQRVAALAERLWNPTAAPDAAEFARRLEVLDARLDRLLFPVAVHFDRPLHLTPTEFPGVRGVSFAHAFRGAVTLRCATAGRGEIRVAADGAPFAALDRDGLQISATTRVDVGLFDGATRIGRPRTVLLRRIDPIDADANLALGKPVTSDAAPDPLHPEALLTDGNRERMAQVLRYPTPVAFTIDLQRETTVREIRVFAFHGGPEDRERYVLETSTDGADWALVVDRREGPATTADGEAHPCAPRAARFVRITSHGNTRFPGTMCRLVEVEVR